MNLPMRPSTNHMKPKAQRVFLVLALTAGLAAGCAAPIPDRRPDTETAPAPRETKSSPAVVELSTRARQALADSRHDAAAQLLERAIRIEPQNGALWHELARVHFQQGNYDQARQLATRSNALLAGDSTLKAKNDELIDAARDAETY